MPLRCLRSLVSVFEMFEKFVLCVLRCFFEMFAQSENWRPIPTIAKIRYAKDVGKRKN